MVATFSNDATHILKSSSPSLRSSGGPPIFPLKGPPPGSESIHGSSFCDVVKRNVFPLYFLVQEVLTPSIPMRKDVISKLYRLSSMMLIYHFNGL
jgi:hypothetical protein